MTGPQRSNGGRRPILEREEQLEVLAAGYDAIRAGAGTLAFIAGEAGVGKTTLVRRFAAEPPDKLVLLGTCDPRTGGRRVAAATRGHSRSSSRPTPRPCGRLWRRWTGWAPDRPRTTRAGACASWASAASPAGRRPRRAVTRREHQVLLLVAAGMSNAEIATRLGGARVERMCPEGGASVVVLWTAGAPLAQPAASKGSPAGRSPGRLRG